MLLIDLLAKLGIISWRGNTAVRRLGERGPVEQVTDGVFAAMRDLTAPDDRDETAEARADQPLATGAGSIVCPHCAKHIPQDLRACPHCGGALQGPGTLG